MCTNCRPTELLFQAFWSAVILRNVFKLVLFTCVRFHHGGALQLQEDYGCAFGKGEDQKRILSAVSVYKVLMKVIAASGLCRHRSFENSTENSDGNSSVSCLFDSAVCTLRLQVVRIYTIVTTRVTI